jgi:nicotinamide phosphoribosyltransferase
MLNNPIFYKDFYKVGHIDQYPEGTTLIYSNFTPRKSRMPGINHCVFFGLQAFIREILIEKFDNEFFNKDIDAIMDNYKQVMKECLGADKDYNHIRTLHKLGYLPIEIRALPEGAIVPFGVPALTIHNTLPEFFWITNMLETMLSSYLWGMCTTATMAREYRLILDTYAKKTSDNPGFVDYQAHDFSFRGMSSIESAMRLGVGHLLYFKGTDTIPAILFSNKYYHTDFSIGQSVSATEHSVMSAGGKDTELETYRRLINNVYPSGIVSIVSDTWDLYNVVDNYLPLLKDDILKREGKVVIRPDSGDPANIICGNGYITNNDSSSEEKGLIQRLWDIFGGTINSKGYKELDPHIGAIYGDSITLERCRDICQRLEKKGFASTNIVFGIGSYTYQYNTRDTFGWAMKATYAEINGVGVAITKDPKTDDGTKKSHSGLLKVVADNGSYKVIQNVTKEQLLEKDNELKIVFKGNIY